MTARFSQIDRCLKQEVFSTNTPANHKLSGTAVLTRSEHWSCDGKSCKQTSVLNVIYVSKRRVWVLLLLDKRLLFVSSGSGVPVDRPSQNISRV